MLHIGQHICLTHHKSSLSVIQKCEPGDRADPQRVVCGSFCCSGVLRFSCFVAYHMPSQWALHPSCQPPVLFFFILCWSTTTGAIITPWGSLPRHQELLHLNRWNCLNVCVHAHSIHGGLSVCLSRLSLRMSIKPYDHWQMVCTVKTCTSIHTQIYTRGHQWQPDGPPYHL